MIDVFSYPDITFPEGFLWGASTAGQQVEGNNCSFYDDPAFAPRHVLGGGMYVPASGACNSYELYGEDIALLQAMNLSIYRLSLEWCRIEPEKGAYNQQALAHYRSMLQALKEAGIKVCLTLHHMSHPVWFHKQGHFDTLDNIGDWAKYLEYIVPQIAEYVDFWIILNEPNLPFVYTLDQRLHMLRYHAVGYHIVKRHSDRPASSALSYSPKEPLRGKHDRLDRLMAEYVDFTDTEFFLHGIRTGEISAPFRDGGFDPDLKGSADFWSLNTYVRHMIDGHKAQYLTGHYTASTIKPVDVPTHMDEIHPEIMIDMLMRMRDKPCFITENGIPTKDDAFRIVYISAMLQAMRQAMDLGAEVWGYSHWSLLDNWEWGDWNQPFGLAAVAPAPSFERTLKKSGRFFGEIAKQNGVSQKLVRQYLDRLPSVKDRE